MKTKKSISIVVGICIAVQCALGQNITANLIIGKPSAYISDWNKPIAGRLVLVHTPSGSGNTELTVKLFAELKDLNGNIIATSNLDLANPIGLKTGATVLGLDRVIQLDNLNSGTKLQNILVHSGRLPSGNYQLGVQVFADSLGYYIPKTMMQYRHIQVASYQLPYLVSPANEAALDVTIAKSVVIFRWTPLAPLPAERVKYVLQIMELQQDQSRIQALQANAPVFEKTIEGFTQYIWQPNLFLNDSLPHSFIWTIRAVDEYGNSFESGTANSFGISEPAVFYIKPKKSKEQNEASQ